ncbi:hypothetical protein DPMN_109375 [Dreissena polymorpha]|uniref:Uncharacterized protein n=1 Tax=Dreissena polymorpha TaxID=45954 RepID=A0A9D4KB11_DREPO|nr:hypothetical protein DPMN_109375 [Dreissena polymorpha]
MAPRAAAYSPSDMSYTIIDPGMQQMSPPHTKLHSRATRGCDGRVCKTCTTS